MSIADLTRSNRQSRSKEIELQLAEQRLSFDTDSLRGKTAQRWSPASHSPFDVAAEQIPEIQASELGIDAIGNGIHHHGGVIVRNLFSAEQAAQYREQMDTAFVEQDLFDEQPLAAREWFNPPENLLKHPFCQSRGMVKSTGSMWALNSPRLVFNLLEEYEALGLKDICEAYFGEPALLSVKKWVLRRIEPLKQASDWHQDGSFMGSEVRSLNLWIALSDCGGETNSPGLDIKPGRLDRILETGTHGAAFDWSVGEQAADNAVNGQAALTPHFKTGDAVFFDHFNLHRTSFDPSFNRSRYAIECWFLGLGNYPERQIPLRW